jgi:hypothetical protein
MRYLPRAVLAGGLGFAAAFVVACGGGAGLLSGDQASTLNNQLDQLTSAAAAGQCGAASGAASSFSNAIDNLQGVNQRLVENLKEWATTVGALTARDCRAQTVTSATTTATTPTTTPHTSSTQSTTTRTQPTQTLTTPPATTSAPPGNTTTTGTGGAGLTGATTGNAQ